MSNCQTSFVGRFDRRGRPTRRRGPGDGTCDVATITAPAHGRRGRQSRNVPSSHAGGDNRRGQPDQRSSMWATTTDLASSRERPVGHRTTPGILRSLASPLAAAIRASISFRSRLRAGSGPVATMALSGRHEPPRPIGPDHIASARPCSPRACGAAVWLTPRARATSTTVALAGPNRRMTSSAVARTRSRHERGVRGRSGALDGGIRASWRRSV